MGDPRARRRLDAAQLPVHAADRRPAVLAAARDGAAAAVARQGAADRAAPTERPSTSLSTRASLATGLFLLLAGGTDAAGTACGPVATGAIAVLLGLLGAPGPARQGLVPRRPAGDLRADPGRSRCSRPPSGSSAWQFVLLFIWWGAASSKLNQHFPFVVSTMVSNAPLVRLAVRQAASMWRDYPDDMLPSRELALFAHFGTVQEFLWPLLLITVDNDVVRTVAIVGMILFHVNIASMFPLAVPLEWNIFMIFGIALPVRALRRRPALHASTIRSSSP